jgi:hypothetical protein
MVLNIFDSPEAYNPFATKKDESTHQSINEQIFVLSMAQQRETRYLSIWREEKKWMRNAFKL